MNHQILLKYPFIFAISFILTLLLTPFVGRLAVALGVVDKPSSRRLNSVPIPRGGGVAIFIGFHIACATLFLLPWGEMAGTIDFAWWRNYLLVSSALLCVGIVDDIRGLSAKTKLFAQIALASSMYMLDVRMANVLGADLPQTVDFFGTVLWFLVITNAFNLIDGLDGLATGLAIIAACGIAGVLIFRRSPGDVLILVALVGACAAFLRFNFHPASIFLGDSGSLFLGFTLAAVSLSTVSKAPAVASIGVSLLAVGVPIFDTMLAVWRRSLRKIWPQAFSEHNSQGIMQPDMKHLHHRLLAQGGNQTRVAVWLYGANVCLVAVGLLSMFFSSQAVGMVLISFVVGTYVVVKHVVHVEIWDTGSVIMRGLLRPRSPMVASVFYPLADFAVLVLSLAISIFIVYPEASPDQLKVSLLEYIPFWCGIPFLMLVLSKTYSRVWSRARLVEYLIVGVSIFAGVLLSYAVFLMTVDIPSNNFFVFFTNYAMLSFLLILGVRAMPRIVQEIMSIIGGGVAEENGDSSVTNVLMYGAGVRCMHYLRGNSAKGINTSGHQHICGIIDDDRNLRKRLVYGYRVLGGIEELQKILQSQHIDEIVLAAELSEAKLEALRQLADKHQTVVTEFSVKQEAIFHHDPSREGRFARVVNFQ